MTVLVYFICYVYINLMYLLVRRCQWFSALRKRTPSELRCLVILQGGNRLTSIDRPPSSLTQYSYTHIYTSRDTQTQTHTRIHIHVHKKNRINIFYKYLEASPPGCCPLCLLVWAKSGCGRKIWEKSQQIVWEESGTRSGGWEVWARCGGAGLVGGSTPSSLCCKQKLYINGIINQISYMWLHLSSRILHHIIFFVYGQSDRKISAFFWGPAFKDNI